jgi:hypothetical protein
MSDQDREHDATGPARKIICEQVSGPPLSEATQRGKPDGWLRPDEATYATGGSLWPVV